MLPPGVTLTLGFCATGVGGGVDPTCGKPGGGVTAEIIKARDDAKAQIKSLKAAGEKKGLAAARRMRAQANKALADKAGVIKVPKAAQAEKDTKESSFIGSTIKAGSEKPIGEGVNTTYKVEMSDGSHGYYKPQKGEYTGGAKHGFAVGSLAEREVAAYQLDKALGFGLVPETQMLVGKEGPGSVQKEVADAKVACQASHGTVTKWMDSETGKDQAARCVAFDYIATNFDRHGNNYMFSKSGDLKLIDNGFTMQPKNLAGKVSFRSNYMTQIIKKMGPDRIKKVAAEVQAFIDKPDAFRDHVLSQKKIGQKQYDHVMNQAKQFVSVASKGLMPSEMLK